MRKIGITILYIVTSVIAFVLAVIFLYVILSTMVAPAVNDRVAKETADTLVELPLPEDTEWIETVYKAGKLVGCGNGMQYFGAILIRSGLSMEELQEYYSDYAEHEWECEVESQPDSEIVIAFEHIGLEFQTDIAGDDYYIVYSWGSSDSIFAMLDLRGH